MKINLVTICLVACVATPVSAFAKSDKDFVRDAMKGDNSEVALGQLAQTRGSSAKIRDFGTVLATDHAKAREEVGALASKIGVKSTTSMTDAAKKEMQKLKGLAGAAFDDEFAGYMVKDHKKDIQDFKKEANKQKGEVPELAAKQVPVLTKHLQMAERLSAQ